MAKASKKSGRKIKVNMEGVQNFTLVPEGDYKIKIAEITKENSDNSGNDYLAWTFEIAEGKFKGQKLFYNTSLVPKALWNLRGVLEAFGHEVPDAVMDLDLDEIESIDEVAGCTVEHEKYEGKNRARIADIFSAENIDGDGGEGGGELPDEDAINAMGEDELKELISDLELDVDPDDHKKIKALRKAVIEAVEEKRNAGDDSKNGDDVDLPSEEDVDGMDEDELKELIDEHDLDVDPEDYKKVKALRNAVNEALDKKREGGGDDGNDDDDDDEDKVTEDSIKEIGKDELKAFVKEHKLKVELEGSTSKQRRAVIKAAKDKGIIED